MRVTAAYAPASSFGWLDFDAAASDRVATLLRAMEEPGTLDPLGLGSVRDVFSDLMAPGTSTIQARLRYFLFIPWICQRIERDRVPPSRFRQRLRADEARLIELLRHLGPNQGIQGYTAGAKLQRMPSEAYWGGLYAWKVRQLDLSIAEYGKQLPHLTRHRAERDDDGSPIRTPTLMWNSSLPEAPDDFLEEDATFELRLEEADFLADSIRTRHPASLLAQASRFATEASLADYPWEIPSSGLTAQVRETLHHARCVSELTVGPQHLYNLLLCRRASKELGWDTSDLEVRVEGDLADWVRSVDERHAVLAEWVDHLDDFWHHVNDASKVPEGAQVFVTRMVKEAVADPQRFTTSTEIHNLISSRESKLKKKRARLTSRLALENWNGAPFGGQLTYRWGIARSYLADLGEALDRRA